MIIKEERIVRVCNFYVNNWHLLTMLFPYLNKNMDKKTRVVTVLENSLESYAETLIEKIILNNRDKEKIKNINWKEKSLEDESLED